MDKYEEPGFSGMHKMKPFCFGNIEKKRITESRAMECNRRQKRTSTFNSNRNIDNDGQENNSSQKSKCSAMEDRKILLAKWKEERELLKNKMKEKQKPLFKVGIVHHNIASPVFRDISNEKIITRSKTVAKTLPKKANQLASKIKKSSVVSSSSKNNDKLTVFNKTTMGTGTAVLKPTVLKNNVSPVNTFPFNKQKYTFSFRGVSNKKLTEPHSPSFMHSRVKRTPVNKRLLSKKPLFLVPKDSEDKDEDQLAYRLTENCSMPELKCTVASYDQISEQNVNENANLPLLTSKVKGDKDRATDEDQLEPILAENSLALKRKCTRSSCEQNKSENAKPCDASFISAESNISHYSSKSEEIKEVTDECDGNNKENEGTQILRDITHDKHTAGTDNYDEGNKKDKDIQALNDMCEKSPAGLSVELANNLTDMELKSNENCSPSAINTETFVISPFVTVHRGKRRSRGRRRTSSAGMPIVRDECRIKSPDSVKNECSKYHRNQLDRETGRLLSLADDWEGRAFVEALPASIADEISGIVGQTRLLTRDKFQQFRSLIEQFENNDGPVKITDNDLAGFWEMVYLQVEHLNRKYSRLEELKNNNWQEQTAVSTKKRKTAVKLTKPVAKSRFRDFLQGKKLCDRGTENSAPTETPVPPESSYSTEISTPIKQVAPSGGSQRYSSNYSPAAYVAMNTSSLGKALGHSPAIVIHNAEGNATPKSILKKKLTQSVTGSHRKKTVLFGDDLMPCDVKSESVSHFVYSKREDTENETSSNDPVLTINNTVAVTNDPMVATNDPVDVTNDPAVITNDPVVATNDPAVATNDPAIATNDPAVATNDLVVATNDPAVATNDPAVANPYTPRRSARLANKTSSTSKAPLNTSSSCVDDSSSVTIQNTISVPEKPLKKFSLKPSSLCINPEEIIKLNVEKVQKTKNKKAVKNKREHSDSDDCNIDSCESSFEPSVETRKSKRLSRMESDIRRTVTFEPGFDERSSAHYRKTPYKKHSRRSVSTEHE